MVLILLAALCGTASAQQTQVSSIDVLKGESWWGVFIGSDRRMPFDAPFEKIDLATSRRQTTPMLVSSRGRYIWSAEPFTIEYTGEKFVIESDHGKVQAVTAGKTLREAYLVCVHKNMPPDGKTPSAELFTAPVYDLSGELGCGESAEGIMECTSHILSAGYPAGTFVIPGGWQSQVGSLDVDRDLFGDFQSFVAKMHSEGFKVMLTITPYVSGDGKQFRIYRDGGVVRMPDGSPAMVDWEGGYSAFYDITDPKVAAMMKSRLDSLRSVYGVDGFLFDCRGVMPLMRYAKGGMTDYLRRWTELSLGCDFVQYTISRGSGFAPYVHNINAGRRFDWEFLRRSVRDVVSANLLGYPYITVSAGMSSSGEAPEMDPKFLLRYMQLATIMPVMNITFAPWNIADKEVAAACVEYAKGRSQFAAYYRELLEESAKTAEPIIRHMEYVFPRNGFTDCDDQFMIGSRYMIAPLLTESDGRTVRFPKGNWIDSEGRRYKGPVVTTVTATDNKLLFFELVK